MGEDFTAKDFRTWVRKRDCVRDDGVQHRGRWDGEAEERDGAGRRSARQHARDQPQILCPPRADRSGQGCGAIGKRSFRARQVSELAERGLIEFLDVLPQAEAEIEAKVESKQRSKGKTKAAAEAEVSAEAQAKLEAEAA
jgi:hypothetical protein